MSLHPAILSSTSVLFFGLSLTWLAPLAQLRAEIEVSDFEDSRVFDGNGSEVSPIAPHIANQSFAGLPYDVGNDTNVPSNIRSGNVTFSNDGISSFGSWSGTGYSQKSAVTPDGFGSVTYYEHGNDFVPMSAPVPGTATGAGGSSTWGVIYSSATLTADAGYIFDSLSVTNIQWAWDVIKNGDPNFAANFAFSDGDFFTVLFTKSGTTDSVAHQLADFRDPDDEFILTGWDSVDLSGLNASQLEVSFVGSRNSDFGLLTPAYVAIDDVAVASVAAVPEPSSLALLAAGGSVGVWFRWRKRRRAPAPPSVG